MCSMHEEKDGKPMIQSSKRFIINMPTNNYTQKYKILTKWGILIIGGKVYL